MSGQQSQLNTPTTPRLQLISSNISSSSNSGVSAGGYSKQIGPLKATIPITSVTKQGSELSKTTAAAATTSSINNTNWRTKTDYLSGQRSPGSTTIRGKSRLCNKLNEIRRTASLDTIHLKGFVPSTRDGLLIQKNRATQTDISNSLDSSLQILSTKIHTEDNLGKLRMKRRRSSSRESNNSDRNFSPIDFSPNKTILTHTVTSSSQTTYSPNKTNKSSEEGLNQEIERIILSETDLKTNDRRYREPTPEGRKAPVSEILRIAGDLTKLDLDEKNEPTTLQSPKINKYLLSANQILTVSPTVQTNSIKLIKPIPIERVQEIEQQPPTVFQLKPSSCSAFQCLNKIMINDRNDGDDDDDDDDNSPKVPDN